MRKVIISLLVSAALSVFTACADKSKDESSTVLKEELSMMPGETVEADETGVEFVYAEEALWRTSCGNVLE